MTDLRTLERDSIRAFVQSAADEGYLSGRVLDYGCGKQPYRDIVEAVGGEYRGYDRTYYPGNVSELEVGREPECIWADTILCTQVVQYIPTQDLWGGLYDWAHGRSDLVTGGHLVLTYPTNWPEVEPEDLHRFTKAGMERLLTEAGFEIVRHERRAEMANRGDVFALGYGVICRA